jgi:hypothetical protein
MVPVKSDLEDMASEAVADEYHQAVVAIPGSASIHPEVKAIGVQACILEEGGDLVLAEESCCSEL